MAKTKRTKKLAKVKEEEEESIEEEMEEKPIKKKKITPKKQKEEKKVLSTKRGRSKKKNVKEDSEEEDAVDINDDPKISESDSEGEKGNGKKKAPLKKPDKTKKKTQTITKKTVNRNFIKKEDVNITEVITVKKIKNILYAYVMYTEKGKKKSPVNKGLIKTSEFINSEPERLLSFYESKIEFTPDRLSEDEEDEK